MDIFPFLDFWVSPDHVLFLRLGRMLEYLVFWELDPFFIAHGQKIANNMQKYTFIVTDQSKIVGREGERGESQVF